MKFSGPGRMALYELKKYMEKHRKFNPVSSEIKKKPKSDAHKNREPKSDAHKNREPKSDAHKNREPKSDAHKKIEQSFKFEATRKFPLGGVVYSPDYILTKTRVGKKIIIHVDIGVVGANASMYKLFMKTFRNAYYLIIVVSDGYLRTWNEKDRNRHILFDEIWTVNNVNYMIESVKNPRGIDQRSDLVVCSICHKQANGTKKIKNNFVYRSESDGSLTIQPYCRKCRRKMHSQRVTLVSELSIRCIGCGMLFRTKIASQIYCNPCENSLAS